MPQQSHHPAEVKFQWGEYLTLYATIFTLLLVLAVYSFYSSREKESVWKASKRKKMGKSE